MEDDARVERLRIRLLAAAAGLVATLATAPRSRARSGRLPAVTVYKTPT